jgi:acetylornithine deacetylase/succinyl-diaminopimelate desuccinylase-like protein
MAQTKDFQSAHLTDHQKLARDLFRELIEINTADPIGSTKAAEAMSARLKAMGFAKEDVHLLGPHANKQNLVARFRGDGTLKPILFIAHLDVVEARKDDWSIDPFKFLERDGYFYGRGSSDMKEEVASILANFIRLKKEGFTPARDIILALTADEETGDDNGVEWLIAKHRDLIDAEYGINLEGGGGDIKNGQQILMEVQTGEKVYLSFRLEVKNPGGHSSRPVKENAIYRLAEALNRVSRHTFPVRLNETTHIFFERLASREKGQLQKDILAMLHLPPDTAAADRVAATSPYYNALLRTTCIPTMLNAGHAENALPQTASAVLNCRMLPDESPESVERRLEQVIADTLVNITRLNEPFQSPISSLRNDLMQSVEQITTELWPSVHVSPVMSTGSTDAKYLRKAGIPVYGVSGTFFDVDDSRAHGKDERIGVKEFYEGTEFMYRLIKTLTAEKR